MTPLDPNNGAATRVSIIERLGISSGLALSAIAGVVGAAMTLRFLNSLRNSESAGYYAFFTGAVEIEFVLGIVLAIAALVIAIGVLISVIRMFTDNTKASPPGALFLLVALLAAVPPFLVHYVVHSMKRVVIEPVEGGIASVASTVTTFSFVAIGSGILVVLILLAFAFVPFSSRPGRKVSPAICAVIAALVIASLSGLFFWEARNSLLERERLTAARDVDYHTPPPPTGKYTNETPPPINVPEFTNKNAAPSGSKTVSGGVLNGKAVELPQPDYPPAARAVRATGQVSVMVTVSETGEVIEAVAVSGHPLLRAAATAAARKARFAPTLLGGKPVRVTGVLTYNFTQ